MIPIPQPQIVAIMVKNYIQKLITIVLFTLPCSGLRTQNIKVEMTDGATEWLKPMVAGETIAFPAPGNSAMTPVTYFRITNTGAAQLNISSINVNSVAFLVTPGSTSLAPNQTGDFYITYINNNSFMSVVNAQVTINSNASSGAFTFNIKGAPGDLYGPM